MFHTIDNFFPSLLFPPQAPHQLLRAGGRTGNWEQTRACLGLPGLPGAGEILGRTLLLALGGLDGFLWEEILEKFLL